MSNFFGSLTILLLALYGLFALIEDVLVWTNPYRMRLLAYRLMKAADRKEKKQAS